jgi:hypothetical protein
MRAFILSVTFLCSFSAAAASTPRQDDVRRVLDAKLVAVEGRAARDFVPRGWKIEGDEGELTGDLNKDGVPDKVLRLVEDIPVEGAEGTYNERFRALVILFAQPGGGFKRAAVATKLLGCTLCAGMLGDPAGGNIQIEIKNGVLNVNQLSGARESTDLTQRFRYDAAAGRFQLIGQDVENSDRLEGNSTTESTNYLTGVKVKEVRKVKRENADPVLVSRKTLHVAAARRYIEDMDYERQ